MDKLAGMEAFVRVVETGSFSLAAKQLGLARALVGKRVAALEKEMGAQLLHRTTRSISVTGQGSEFYSYCRRIVDEFNAARDQLGRNQAQPQGTIRLNAPMSFGRLCLTPALLAFKAQQPDILLHLSLSDRQVDVVAEGYDLVLRIGALADSTLISRRIRTLPQVLCAAPDYLARAGQPDSAQALSEHKILHYGFHRPGMRWQLQHGGEMIDVHFEPVFCADNGEVLACAAAAGHGITQLPAFIAQEHLDTGRLVTILDDHRTQAVGLHLLWPHNRLQPLRVRTLIDFLLEWFH